MRTLAAIGGVVLLIAVLRDAFYTVVLGRRAERTIRASRFFYQLTWPIYTGVAKRIKESRSREDLLSVYGPLSLLALVGLWASGVILSFGFLLWASGAGFWDGLYYSGTTLFEVGSPTARHAWPRLLNVVEAGIGFGFLGLVVSFLPVVYRAYSDREVQVLPARRARRIAAFRKRTPGSAGQNPDKLESELSRWERWAAQLIQNHISYPMLAYFRSQHTNQAWLASLVAVVDASAVVMLAGKEDLQVQAQITFAAGNRVIRELAEIFAVQTAVEGERLPLQDFDRLRERVSGCPVLESGKLLHRELPSKGSEYESNAAGLARHFLIALPGWLPQQVNAVSDTYADPRVAG